MNVSSYSPWDIGLCDAINETNALLQHIQTGDFLFFPYQQELDWNAPGLPFPLYANQNGYCYQIVKLCYGNYSSTAIYRLPSLTGKNIFDQSIRELIELRFLPLPFQTSTKNAVFTLPFPYIPRFVKPFPHSSKTSEAGYLIKPFPEYYSLTKQQIIHLKNEMEQYKQREQLQLQSFDS